MSAGVAARPLDGCDLSIGGRTGSSGGDFRPVLLAQTVAAELQAMRVVNDAVEDGVGEGGLADQVVPAVDRDLAGDQRGAAAGGGAPPTLAAGPRAAACAKGALENYLVNA